MTTIEEALTDRACPQCRTGQLRPRYVLQLAHQDRERVKIECSNPLCRARELVDLPTIRKCTVYLDTSIIVHMGRAVLRGERHTRWWQLAHAMEDAVENEIICCPASTVAFDELRLHDDGAQIGEFAMRILDPILRTPDEVLDGQIACAFRRYRKTPSETTAQDVLLDAIAFSSSPHRWRGGPRFWSDSLSAPIHDPTLRGRRDLLHEGVASIYSRYATEQLSRQAICDRESGGLGRTLIDLGRDSIARKLEWASAPASTTPDCDALLNVSLFESLLHAIEREGLLGPSERAPELIRFLLGEEVRTCPISHINSEMRSWIAHDARPGGRPPSHSDGADIRHAAYYLPYVDVFVADKYAANLLEKARLGAKYNTTVIRTGDSASLHATIDKFTRSASHASLARRLHAALRENRRQHRQHD